MTTQIIYTALIYMRLSNDDKSNESLSITNQRSILKEYCSENNITIVREFIDDGWSGGNFERPGFKDMLDFLKKNQVDYVITKDLSRLGRDMSEASYYAERYFPEHGIRYLAISDHFDSFEDNMLAPFQFAMNDVYIRDASRKVKTVLMQKKKNGKYCACPPFGYRKSTRQRDVLVPDENTAPIVQMIFDMAAKGNSTYSIANTLTDNNIITPLKYRVLYRDEFGEEGASRATDVWNHTTIKRIIRNRVYLGDTLLGKSKKLSPKSTAKIQLSEEEWFITEGTHEPLVSKEKFDQANNAISNHATNHHEKMVKNGDVRKSIFRGLVFCENCGGAMVSGGTVYKDEYKSYWYLNCNNIPKRSTHHCEHGARIKYFTLIDLVKNELNALIDLTDEQRQEIVQKLRNDSSEQEHNTMIENQITLLNKEISDSNKVIEKLYLDNVNGKISDERLESLVTALEQKLIRNKENIVQLESQIIHKDSIINNYEKLLDLVGKYDHIEELTPDILHTFIDRIEIGEASVKRAKKQSFTQNVKIYYKFIGNISQ